MTLYATTIPSPVGDLTLVASDAGLVAVLWRDEQANRFRAGPLVECADHPVLVTAARQLREYFAGERITFVIPLDDRGTDFQRAVWAALRAIPHGQTRSYADLAHAVGRPRAVRAVGAANGANPLPIVSPCHRVIGSDGALTGFAAGLRTKRWLLDHERGECVLL